MNRLVRVPVIDNRYFNLLEVNPLMGLGGSGGYRPARRGLSGIEYYIFKSGRKPKYLFGVFARL